MPHFRPTGELSKLWQLPDEARRLLVVSTEGKDSLVGGVGRRIGVARQRGVERGKGPGLDRQAGCELIIQQTTGSLTGEIRRKNFICF